MIDRNARNEMSEVIERYLAEETTAFQFDDALTRISDKTQDQTVCDVAMDLYFLYDDFRNHKIVASKAEWDYFQRLLLLLKSDGRIEVVKRRRWTIRQLIAVCCLTLFVVLALRSGFGAHLMLLATPFGFISMSLSYWRHRAARPYDRTWIPLIPFFSCAGLLAVHRTVPTFSKRQYPPSLATRRIRSRALELAMWIRGVLMWLVFSPLVLLLQAMPENWSVTKVVIP